MTAITMPGASLAPEPATARLWWAIKDTWVLTRRSIARILREPEQLSDVTIQPVIFVLLFTYVFGSAILLPGGGSYHQYLISGMFGMTMAGSAPGTAVGLTTDMFAMTWAGACAGMLLRSPEAAQALGFIVFLPLSFVSNAFVPTQGMPPWLRAFANWNPMSAVAASCRELFGGPNPARLVQAWPMQHPEMAVVIWSVALIAIFAPTAVFLFRRKVLR